jgi:DNA-binding response OmpR family regulator
VPCYDDGFLRVDPGACEASVGGRAAALTPTEFRLLSALIAHRGQVLSPSQLLELAWNDPGRVGPERVKFSVMRLRRKLGYRYVPPATRLQPPG